MKWNNCILFLLIAVTFIACDAAQEADGFILDKGTRMPIDSVAIGQGEKGGDNPFHNRIYSLNDGSFHYFQIGPSRDFELYISKKGYKTIKKECKTTPKIDTIYLEKVK